MCTIMSHRLVNDIVDYSSILATVVYINYNEIMTLHEAYSHQDTSKKISQFV